MDRALWRLIAWVVAMPLGCAPTGGDTVAVTQDTVYGTDRRVDVYAETDTAYQAIAEQSAVVLVSAGIVDATDPAHVRLQASTLGTDQVLCTGENFASDPDPGFCSGTLIDDDLVLTAGHCLAGNGVTPSCQGTQVVFGFYRTDPTTLHTITADDVYTCTQIVAWADGHPNGGYHDYTVFRLDRPVTAGHTPAAVYKGHAPLPAGAGIAVVGFPDGIPCKLDTGANVLQSEFDNGDDLVANTDTFSGNSGSGIYLNTTHELYGILLEGNSDYQPTAAGCQTAFVCPATGCSNGGGPANGEIIGYGRLALDALCSSAYSPRLCCGNGTCETAENAMTCPADCNGMATSTDGGSSDGSVPLGAAPHPSGCGCEIVRTDVDGGFAAVAGIAIVTLVGARRRRERG